MTWHGYLFQDQINYPILGKMVMIIASFFEVLVNINVVSQTVNFVSSFWTEELMQAFWSILLFCVFLECTFGILYFIPLN